MHHEPSRRHFLIRLAGTEQLCCAIRELAGQDGAGAAVGETTIRALMAAHREAAGEQLGRRALRSRAPAGAEQLLAAAAITVRGDVTRLLSPRHPAAVPREP
jgi:hypothetical protein